jgi:hypothetical protein
MTLPTRGLSQPPRDPARVVIVVPRKEIRLHDYLRRSLAQLKNVEVVLDRRTVAITRSQERRRQSSSAESRILMCSLVRCPPEDRAAWRPGEPRSVRVN